MLNQEHIRRTSWKTLAFQVTAITAIVAAHVPLLVVHFARLWQGDQYRYFPFVLTAFALLVWARSREPLPQDDGGRCRGLLLLTLGLLTLAVATLLWSPALAAVAAILSVGGLLRQCSGRKRWRFLLPVWLLLWLIVPLPFRWDSRLVFWLQGITSKAASFLLDLFGYTHVLAGHVIEIPGQQFLVEEACSGIRSLFSLVALAAVFAVLLRRPLVHLVLMIVSAVFWAVVVNIARVTAVVVFQVDYGIDITAGWQHQLFGLVLFSSAMFLLLSTDRLLVFLLEPGEPEIGGDEQVTIPERDEAVTTRVPRLSLLAVALFAVFFSAIGTVQLVSLEHQKVTLVTVDSMERLQITWDEDTLPDRVLDWNRVGFQQTERDLVSNLGRHTSAWTYQRGATSAVVSFDYPFVGWHHLTDCYRAQGWEIRSRSVKPPPQGYEPDLSLVEVKLRRPSGENGYLLFQQFDARGNPVRPPDKNAWTFESLMTALQNRLSTRLMQLGVNLSTYQVQVFVSGEASLDPTRRGEVARMLLASRKAILAQFPKARSTRAALVP